MSKYLRFRRRKRPAEQAKPSVVERLERIRQEQLKLHRYVMMAGAALLCGAIGWMLI